MGDLSPQPPPVKVAEPGDADDLLILRRMALAGRGCAWTDLARLLDMVDGLQALVRGLVNAAVPTPPLLDRDAVYIDCTPGMPGGWSLSSHEGFGPLADADPALAALLVLALGDGTDGDQDDGASCVHGFTQCELCGRR